MKKQSDEAILVSIKTGDMAAFNVLFKAVYVPLYVHCRKFIAEPEEAKDLLQNVFLRFWEKKEEIDVHTSLNAYLYRSVQNECLNYIRSVKPQEGLDGCSHEELFSGLNGSEATPFSNLAVLEIEQIVNNTIERLPKQCKSIFKLSRIEGLKNQEIADRLCMSVRTVDTQIYRALKILKGELKDYLAT